MRIVVIVAGTEGDARPNIALARGLEDAGHDTLVLTSREFEQLVVEAGIAYAPLTADFRRMMAADKERLDGKPAIVTAWHGLRRLREMARSWVAEAHAVVEGAGLIIGSGGALYFASALAQSRNIPFVRTAFHPTEPTREIPPVMFPPPRVRLPGPVSLLLYAAMRNAGWQVGRPVIARLHAELGLRPPSRRGPWRSPWLGRSPILHAFSRHLVTPPKDWGAHVATTGFWILQGPANAPPAQLRRFLDNGPAPIYVGFGSMVVRDLTRFASIIAEALRLARCRAVILSGWSELAKALDGHPDTLILQRASHEFLFPRVKLAVHHCGAGTTAAVLRAGIPSVAVPFLFDQFFWARNLHRLGAAPPPLSRKRMTPRALADAVAQAQAPDLRAAAAALGERVRAENGVGDAIASLRRWNLLPAAAPCP